MSGKLVITKMGGVNKVSKLMNRAYTTVQYWWDNDMIPSCEQKRVLALCKENNFDVTPETFFMEYEV